jgi:hypothetical protein
MMFIIRTLFVTVYVYYTILKTNIANEPTGVFCPAPKGRGFPLDDIPEACTHKIKEF